MKGRMGEVGGTHRLRSRRLSEGAKHHSSFDSRLIFGPGKKHGKSLHPFLHQRELISWSSDGFRFRNRRPQSEDMITS
jgi:hypothetical protein